MSEDHNRSAGRQLGDIVLEPRHLLVADRSHAFELRCVVQPDEMDPFVIEALPTPSLRTVAETFEVLLTVIAEQVMFAGDVECLLLMQSSKELVQGVEFS